MEVKVNRFRFVRRDLCVRALDIEPYRQSIGNRSLSTNAIRAAHISSYVNRMISINIIIWPNIEAITSMYIFIHSLSTKEAINIFTELFFHSLSS